MDSSFSLIEKTANTIVAPFRIIKDKAVDAVKDFWKGEKHDISRLYPKNGFIEKISDHGVFFSQPTLVYPRIYLGSVYNAVLWKTLVDNNIKFIINVTSEITNWYPNDIEYLQIPMKDNNNESLKQYFSSSFNAIEDFLQNKEGNILIHCYFGASRSLTIVTDYIRRKTSKPVMEIIQEIKLLRPIINPTQQFLNDLDYTFESEEKN